MTDERNPRDVIARAIMETATAANDLDGHLLLGFGVVVEWIAPDGQRYLTCTGGSGEGQTIPEWTVQGYFANALGGMAPWTVDTDDDDEDGPQT